MGGYNPEFDIPLNPWGQRQVGRVSSSSGFGRGGPPPVCASARLAAMTGRFHSLPRRRLRHYGGSSLPGGRVSRYGVCLRSPNRWITWGR